MLITYFTAGCSAYLYWGCMWTRQDLFGFPSFNFHDFPWASQDRATSNLGGKRVELILLFLFLGFRGNSPLFVFLHLQFWVIERWEHPWRWQHISAHQAPQTLAAVLTEHGGFGRAEETFPCFLYSPADTLVNVFPVQVFLLLSSLCSQWVGIIFRTFFFPRQW